MEEPKFEKHNIDFKKLFRESNYKSEILEAVDNLHRKILILKHLTDGFAELFFEFCRIASHDEDLKKDGIELLNNITQRLVKEYKIEEKEIE